MEQTTETLSMGWLSAAIWVPIISGIVVLAVGNEQRATPSRGLAPPARQASRSASQP